MNERKGFLLSLILGFGAIVGMMLLPFAAYILGAVIIAFVLKNPYSFLKNYVGERPAAFILTLSSILLAILPVLVGGMIVADDARNVVQNINQSEILDFDSVEQLVLQYTNQEIDLQSSLSSLVRRFSSTALGDFSQVVNLLTQLSIGISLALFLIYYFLKDGKDLVKWLKDVSPLPKDIGDNLVSELESTTAAVMKGHILVAIAQGILAGIGLALFGVPNYLFWTFMMIILGMIPVLGSMLIWLPAAIYLIVVGQVVNGVLLILYGLIVVGLSDNFLRPFAVDKSADLHPTVIILGVLGGVTVFGMPGLFIGPVIFAALKSVLNIFKEHYTDL